jgi:Kef-type K+ transport system membrane component KefB/Trk K+ transport system NAD-binding subunit
MHSPEFIEETFNFLPLLIVLLLAFVVPIMLARLRGVPVVVGEILAGVLVGGSVLGLVEEDAIMGLMGDIGLAFLMFLAGLEIDFDMLFPGSTAGKGQVREDSLQDVSRRRAAPNLLGSAFLIYALTLILAGLSAAALSRSGLEGNLWLLIFILSATSLGVLLPVLKERDLTRTPFGQIVFVSATLADFITAILLTVFLIVQANGLDPQILTVGLLFLFFFIAYRLGMRFTRLPGVRGVVEELSHSTVQLKVRGAITILLAFVVLAQLVNAELILGAFLAGMVISLIKSQQDEGMIHNLEAFGFGFFIPIFFILVGVNLDLGALLESPESLLLVPVLLIASLFVKVIPMLTARRFLSWREMLSGGLLLNTHLSLEIAVAVIGLRAGLLSPAAATAVTLFAILSVVLMPFLFSVLGPAAPKARQRAILICNAGHDGINVARELLSHGEQVCILDDDAEVLGEVGQAGLATLRAEPEDFSEVIRADAFKGILAMCSNDQWNLALGRAGVQAGIRPVIARVNDLTNLLVFKEAGIQPYLPSLAQNTLLALMARNPDFYNLITSTSDERDMREIVLKNRTLAGRRMRDLRWPGEVLVLAVSRQNEVIIPHGNVQLEPGDRLTLLGSREELDEATSLLQS